MVWFFTLCRLRRAWVGVREVEDNGLVLPLVDLWVAGQLRGVHPEYHLEGP